MKYPIIVAVITTESFDRIDDRRPLEQVTVETVLLQGAATVDCAHTE